MAFIAGLIGIVCVGMLAMIFYTYLILGMAYCYFYLSMIFTGLLWAFLIIVAIIGIFLAVRNFVKALRTPKNNNYKGRGTS